MSATRLLSLRTTSQPLVADALAWVCRGRLFACLVGKVTLRVADGRDAEFVAPTPVVRGDVYHREGGSTLALADELVPESLRVGVSLSGSIHAPHGRPATSLACRFAIASGQGGAPLLDRMFHVFGAVSPAVPTTQGAAGVVPFTSMPVRHERCFGGLDVAANPAGIGLRGQGRPNIVDPIDPRRPVRLAPIDLRWPERRARVGASDLPRFADGVVELAAHLDGEAYQAAPPEMQVPFLAGDEWLLFDHLLPSGARVQTRLPQVALAAQVRRGRGAAEVLSLRIGSLWVDLDRGEVQVVARATLVLAAHESLADIAATVGIVRGGVVPWPSEPAPKLALSAPAVAPRADLGEPPVSTGTTSFRLSDMRPALPFEAGTARAQPSEPVAPVLPFAGAPTSGGLLPPRTDARPAPLPGAPWAGAAGPLPTPREELPFADDETTAAEPLDVAHHAASPAAFARGDASMQDGAGWLPPVSEGSSSLPLSVAPTPAAPPTEWVAPSAPSWGFGAVLSAAPPAVVAPGSGVPSSLESASPVFAPPPMLVEAAGPGLPSSLDANAGRAWGAAALGDDLDSDTNDLRPSKGPAGAEARARFLAARAAGKSLVGLELKGADLSGVDLRGATLANLSLRDADLSNADLTEADLTGADFTAACLDGAILERSSAEGAVFENASLRAVRADGCAWDRARLACAKLAGASLAKASLERVACERASFERANLAGANFARAEGADVSFEGANLEGASVKKASLPRAVFRGGTLRALGAEKADLSHASFAGADLTGATMKGATLVEADLSEACVDGAELRGATLTGARLPAGYDPQAKPTRGKAARPTTD